MQKHLQHTQRPQLTSAPFPPTLTTSTLGLNSSSNRPFTHLAPNPSATLTDSHAVHPVRRPSYSNRHSKDTLFHKDTQNRHLPKQQQAQLEQQQKFQQQLQLQQAHLEFHRQRDLYQMQQRQQPLQQQQQREQQQMVSQDPSSPTNSQHHHHHHHHHHFHVHPLGTPPHEAYLRRLESHPRHSSQRMADTMASMARSRGLGLTASTTSHPALMASSGQSSMSTREDYSSSTESHASSSSSTSSSSSSSRQLQHHHHQHHSLHQSLPQRTNQFSEWTTVKEKERARLLSNMARVRDSQPAVPTADEAKENLKRLSQRIHQRRTRARETILYDLHQGVKTVEAQVHKQVEMVMSKLKDAPGSKYAFALTHTFLTQIPQALSNTILPSAISAVADTVASRTTNSLTTLRGAAGEDEFDEEEDEEDEDELEEADEIENLDYQQRLLLSQLRHDQRLSHQLSSEFDSIALASTSRTSFMSEPTCTSSAPVSTPDSTLADRAVVKTDSVSISSTGASEFLAASTQHNYSSAASQVLNAALPSFIPSMVAPIVCVFSYPTPPASKPNSSSHSTPASSPGLSSSFSGTNSDSGTDQSASLDTHADPRYRAWTTAEQEGLYLAATRFKLRGQWAKIREVMNLHRTELEIEEEYRRLYGEHDDDGSGNSNDDDENDRQDGDSGEVLHDDGDADDEAEAAVFMKFGGGSQAHSSRSAAQSYVPARPTYTRGLMDIQSLINIEPVQPSPVPVRDHQSTGVNHTKNHPQHHGNRSISQALNEKPIRVLKKEFMIDKRFALEDIPMQL
ncbi:hypothetical protein CPB97_001833 [Podila verticillata]|nr:hypothetical protein CPB97_001833 [Podila verticillata]